jgi:hypothetical protein
MSVISNFSTVQAIEHGVLEIREVDERKTNRSRLVFLLLRGSPAPEAAHEDEPQYKTNDRHEQESIDASNVEYNNANQSKNRKNYSRDIHFWLNVECASWLLKA